MNYDLDNASLTATLTATNFDATVVGQAPLMAEIGECARIDVGQAINYVKSGEAEIRSYVDAAIPRLQSSVDLAKDWAVKMDGLVNGEARSAKWHAHFAEENANAARSNANYAQTHKEAALYYCQQAQTASQFADSKASVAESAANSANADATRAETSEDNARVYAWSAFEDQKLSKAWATKTDGLVENTDYSAKYYASQAAQSAATVANVANTDLSNLTTTGEAKFAAKANVADLATVATSGSYADLSNKPDLTAYALDNKVLHLTGTETIGGAKTFSQEVLMSATGNPNISVQKTNMTKGTAPNGDQWQGFFCKDSAGAIMARFRQRYSANKTNHVDIMSYKAGAATDSGSISLDLAYPATGDGYFTSNVMFYPSADNSLNLGISSFRWKQLYAGTTTISTSDERLKQDIEPIPDTVLDAWKDVEFYRYKYIDSVEKKGINARHHTGLVAQRIERVFAAHGLNAFDYGLLCYDEWEAKEAEYDENGEIVTPAQAAGNRYSLRYEECLCLEAACQRRRADRIEARLAALEARV